VAVGANFLFIFGTAKEPCSYFMTTAKICLDLVQVKVALVNKHGMFSGYGRREN
jgi:hypothetical protein